MQQVKQGIFYLLPSLVQYDDECNVQKKIICNLTKIKWRSGNSILIACENKSQAQEIDEVLWKFDLDSFLPHSLFENGKNRHTPITVYWAQCCYDYIPRDILINLMHKQMNFFINFNKIVDFVFSKNILKKWARIRYKSYKNMGFRLRVIDTLDS